MAHNCDNCPNRAKYDKSPNSFMGRFWRWHINFCPGWKGYIKSLSPNEQDEVQEIAKNATTGGEYTPIGELYGFPILVKTESSIREGVEVKQNRFFIEGAYKYTYNNGQLAMADHKATATNFLNALERIPKLIEQYQTENAKLEKDLPTLREIVGGEWKKEDELKQLKSEVATLERKIQLTLIPPQQQQTTENAAEKVQEVIASPISIGNSILTVAGIDKSSESFTKEHVLVVRPATIENRDGKRIKL